MWLTSATDEHFSRVFFFFWLNCLLNSESFFFKRAAEAEFLITSFNKFSVCVFSYYLQQKKRAKQQKCHTVPQIFRSRSKELRMTFFDLSLGLGRVRMRCCIRCPAHGCCLQTKRKKKISGPAVNQTVAST